MGLDKTGYLCCVCRRLYAESFKIDEIPNTDYKKKKCQHCGKDPDVKLCRIRSKHAT